MKNRKRFIRYRTRLRKIARHGMGCSSVCPFCGSNVFLYDRYDAKCCLSCDIWLSKKCGDPKCIYCSARPDSPSEALFLESGRRENPKAWLRKNYQHKNSGRLRHEKRRKNYGENN